MTLRKGLTIAWYVFMFMGAGCLIYLLFALGHSDTMPLLANLFVAITATISGVGLAMLQWIGLPPEPEDKQAKKKKHST
jgi:hypothetical protein